MLTIGERTGSQDELFRRFGDALQADLRVAIPGIIQTFDPVLQRVTVQPAIRERVILNGQVQMVDIPVLLDVPIVIPRAGGFALTLPVQQGDECLVVFGDMCIDGWFQSGGVQNQVEKRRHDLSDGFAILGCWSNPRALSGYSTTGAQLRTGDGSIVLEVNRNRIEIKGDLFVGGNIQYTGQLIGP